jgi:NitT/TauT family transport system ATP-binding protein
MDKSTKNSLPSYLDQSPEVKARFEKLKNRDVILEVKNLVKVYKTNKGETVALKNVSFKTHKREFVCIIRPFRLRQIDTWRVFWLA